MTTALASLVGAFFAFVLVLVGLPPSPDAMVDQAVALVPPDAELLEAGADTGATIIVGWDRHATASFQDERARGIVHELMLVRARDQGWTVEDSGLNRFGNWIAASKLMTNVRITIVAPSHAGDPLGSSRGQVVLSRNEERRAVLFWGFVAAGGLAGGAVGRWASRSPDWDEPQQTVSEEQ